MSFQSPVSSQDRVHERVVDQRLDVTLPLKEELRVDIPVPPGTEDIVKAVRSLRRFKRVEQRTAERMVNLPPLPGSSVEVARFSPRARVQQRAFKQVEDVSWCLGNDVEAIRFTTCEQVKQWTRQETVEAVRSNPV